MRMGRAAKKVIYPHLDLAALDRGLAEGRGEARRAVIVTDGVFSMRGDHAPLRNLLDLARRYDRDYPENVVVVVDDSHGVGAFGATGRGTEEVEQAPPVDLLIGTLGKAFGVNGGYVTGATTLIRYLRERAPTYIYSNPITPGEATACIRAVDRVDSPWGRARLERLRALTDHFRGGLARIGMETLPGAHPVVPLLIRDTQRTQALVAHLFRDGILATGLTYPVVPAGDEEIRAQINADHTEEDLDQVLRSVAGFLKQARH
jgi:glycine C-acetyltransferase